MVVSPWNISHLGAPLVDAKVKESLLTHTSTGLCSTDVSFARVHTAVLTIQPTNQHANPVGIAGTQGHGHRTARRGEGGVPTLFCEKARVALKLLQRPAVLSRLTCSQVGMSLNMRISDT